MTDRRDEQPSASGLRRAIEDSEEGRSVRIGDPEGRPEPGEVIVGRVDAGPNGEREDGYREATPARRIIGVAAAVILVVVVVLAALYFQ